jgi:hypothetical protein
MVRCLHDGTNDTAREMALCDDIAILLLRIKLRVIIRDASANC